MRTLSLAAVVLCAACGPTSSSGNPCANDGGAEATTLLTGRNMKNLSVTDEFLVYIDADARGTLRRANLDGSNDIALYEATRPLRLYHSIVVGQTVWLLEQDEGLSSIVTRILQVPLAGGVATPVVVNGEAMFFLRHETSPERFIVRAQNNNSDIGAIFSLTPDGTLTRLLGPKELDRAQVTDDDVLFLTDAYALHRAPKTADATSAQLGSASCPGSYFRLSSGRILCGGYSSTGDEFTNPMKFTLLDANGGSPRTLFDHSETEGLSTLFPMPAREVGDETVFGFGGAHKSWPLLAVNNDTGALRALACEIDMPRIDVGTGRPELVVAGNFVYWIAGELPPHSIYRVPLR